MEKTNQFPLGYHLILYACGFFLFLEWLYPLHLLGTTDHFFIFLLFAQFCFLISFLQVHWVVGNVIKGAAFIFIIQGLFFNTSLFDLDWVLLLMEDIQVNIEYMLQRDFHLLTGLFRTFLFMLLIWLMSYLLYYWFVIVKKTLVFSICTFIYVGMLDTFTPYDGSWAIARTFVLVMFVISLTNLMKDTERTRTLSTFRRHHVKWLIPILVFSMLAVSLGVFGPKTAGEWQDPIADITHYFNNDQESDGSSGGSGTRKVGYGDNDEHLGGAFEFDDTPLFQVHSPEKHYWRVESKEIYTGKGWIAEERDEQWTYAEANIPLNFQGINVDTEKEEATVSFLDHQEMDKIVYPYGIKKIETDEPIDEYLIHLSKGTIQPTINNDSTSLQNYTLLYDFPKFQANELREAKTANSEALHESYTQIPDALPDRVHALAEEITEEYDTQYDKVRAVEQHFKEANFVYETDDVAVPYEEIDYVDEFLFDTQAGYCDNFSSSMAVMLRTLDIPTRWVKGFTGGTKLDDAAEDEGMYEITNANAHSWVEVYFTDVGWVPFEPTIGFAGSDAIEEEHSTEEGEGEEALDVDDEEVEQEEPEEELENEENKDEVEVPANQKDQSNTNVVVWVAGVLLIIGAVALFIFRYRVMMALVLYSLHRGSKMKAIDRSMRFCLYMCQKKELYKEAGETLRSFAKRVDAAYGMTEMSTLTQMYEKHMYSRDQHVAMDDYTQTWKKVMQQLILDRS